MAERTVDVDAARSAHEELIRDWDRRVASVGSVELAGGVTIVPQTPSIGAEVFGLDPTEPLDAERLAQLTAALLRYKVLMLRSGGAWRMDVDEHTRFCRQLSDFWGIQPDTAQKRMNHSEGLTVHPFLPWLRGYPHVWPTGSVTGGGRQYELRGSEDVENDEPFAARSRARKSARETRKSARETRKSARETRKSARATAKSAAPPEPALRAYKPGSFGRAALAQDSVDNGANGFHFDDGFFHQPPSAVVLNALVLPKVGGDTIFTDMGAAYRGLSDALQERAKSLTQTMDWRHVFPIWEEEAQRRPADDPFRAHVERLKRDYPPSRQPLVRQHPVTGELSIYANLGFTHHVDDVSQEESRQLIALLCRMAERPEYQVRLRWHDVGDTCVYDNRITNHYAVADYGRVGPRALHHIALLGEPTRNAFGEVVG